MKASKLILLAAFAVSTPAFAADGHDHEHAHESLHGGVVVEARDVDLELVARPELIQLYLRDHGEPVDVAGGRAKLTLLAGTEKQEVELEPAGDRLEAAGSFKVDAGTKLIAVVMLPGKSSTTARFTLK